jgi:acid phosphatase type 7
MRQTIKLARFFILSILLTACTPGASANLFIGQGSLLAPASGAPPHAIYLPMVTGLDGSVGSAVTPTPVQVATGTPASQPSPTSTPTLPATATSIPAPSPTNSSHDPVLIGAGDIALCGRPGSTQTAAILASNPGAVVAIGDNAYPDGAPTDYSSCYDPAWGAFKSKTFPVPGNHDYTTAGASGYFNYFGARAADPSQGWYSFNVGSWHILAINSNCSQVGGCKAGSPQEQWVESDLAAHPTKCTLAFWHHPYYSSGRNGQFIQMGDIWQDLYNAGAEIVLSGHDHDYERFAPQDTAGSVDTARGITQFVVGTGGSDFTPLIFPLQPNSLAHLEDVFGVLKLTLHPTSYTWQFIPVSGTFTDSGTRSCH